MFKKGKAVRGSFLFIRVNSNEKGFPRFSFIISKKTAPRAVDRNRLKRLLSEVAAKFIKNNPAKNSDMAVIVNRIEKEEGLCSEFMRLIGNIK